MAAIDEKISTKLTTENTKNRLGLWDNLITEELKMLHKKFFVASTDKVSGNVAFVSQKDYDQVLINELNLNDVSNMI